MLSILTSILALTLPTDSQDKAPTYKEAKADPSKRIAYVKKLVGKLVHDKAKNPKGILQAVFYLPDEKQKKAATKLIEAEYKKDGRAFYFRKEIKGHLAKVEKAPYRFATFFRQDLGVGMEEKAGILLVGDIFSSGTEQDVLSAFEDYATIAAKYGENGIIVSGREVDTTLPAIDRISHPLLIPLLSQLTQLEKILGGKRKVSDGYRKTIVAEYLANHQKYSKVVLKEKKIYDSNNENTLQKEIFDGLNVLLKHFDERMKKVGYEHKTVDKKTLKVELKKSGK